MDPLEQWQPPSLESVRERLGDGAAAFLAPYLEHSGATREDLLALTARSDGAPPPFLEGLRQAERALGPALLREVIGRLGWPRLACGFAAQPFAAVSIGGSFPFVAPPPQAELLAGAGEAQTLWRRHLVVAHGGAPVDVAAPLSDEKVARFRAYNVTHAQLLDEILAVAPLDADRALHVLSLMDRVVADFAALFAGTSDDARRFPGFPQS